MAQFTYKALDSKGLRKNGTIEAANEEAARSSLTRLGLKPLVVKKAGNVGKDNVTQGEIPQ